MEAVLNQATFLAQAQALLGKAISEHTTQRHAEVKSIINKDCQVAPKRMQLGARLAGVLPRVATLLEFVFLFYQGVLPRVATLLEF